MDFYITSYSIANHSITINMVNNKNESMGTLQLPMYIDKLGLKPVSKNFVVPGNNLPKNHPDYYQKNENNSYVYKNEDYYITIDEEFDNDGIYTLVKKNNDKIRIQKKARTHSVKYLEEILNHLTDKLPGSTIEGIIVDLFVKKVHGKEHFKRLNTIKAQSSLYMWDAIAIVQQESGMELEIPVKYLTNELDSRDAFI